MRCMWLAAHGRQRRATTNWHLLQCSGPVWRARHPVGTLVLALLMLPPSLGPLLLLLLLTGRLAAWQLLCVNQ